jgi:2'-5' RNA ligase
MSNQDILLVTLKMDDAALAHFDVLRRRYFPVELNHLPAHITLFHALPGTEKSAITTQLQQAASSYKPFLMRSNGVTNLGKGVAYAIHSLEAIALHAKLQAQWFKWLKPQDQMRGFKPHITVQNKVDPVVAEELHRELSRDFTPQNITAMGFDLWLYQNGPWKFLETFAFKPQV